MFWTTKRVAQQSKNNSERVYKVANPSSDFQGGRSQRVNLLYINIDIYKHPNWDTFILKLYIVDYLSKQNNFGLMFLNSLENKSEFKNIEDVISFLLLYFSVCSPFLLLFQLIV